MRIFLKNIFQTHFIFLTLLFLFFSCFNFCFSQQEDLELQSLKQTIQKLQTSTNFSAKFEQKQKNITLGITKTSLGTIFIKKDKKDVVKFRFETFLDENTQKNQNEATLLISDGKQIWYFLPPEKYINSKSENEKGLLTIRKADSLKSQPAVRLLAGLSKIDAEFKVEKLNTKLRFRLIPKLNPKNKNNNHNDLQYIELELEKGTNLVYKILLKNQLGNETELTLKEQKFSALSENSFQFIPPPGMKFDTETID